MKISQKYALSRRVFIPFSLTKGWHSKGQLSKICRCVIWITKSVDNSKLLNSFQCDSHIFRRRILLCSAITIILALWFMTPYFLEYGAPLACVPRIGSNVKMPFKVTTDSPRTQVLKTVRHRRNICSRTKKLNIFVWACRWVTIFLFICGL